MASKYEPEQKQLTQEVKENEKTLVELQKQAVDMKILYHYIDDLASRFF